MDMQVELGHKIRKLRLEKKMSLKDLSEITKLSIGFLSMMERGLTSVAIVSLKKIADALEHDISDFFQKTEHVKTDERHVICRSYLQNISYQNGKYIYLSLSDGKPDHIIDPMIVILLPGQTREEVIQFQHIGEEFVYVLDGILTFFMGEKEFDLCPGDSFLGPCDQPHNFVNLTNNIVKVLFILTPPLHSKAQDLRDRHKEPFLPLHPEDTGETYEPFDEDE